MLKKDFKTRKQHLPPILQVVIQTKQIRVNQSLYQLDRRRLNTYLHFLKQIRLLIISVQEIPKTSMKISNFIGYLEYLLPPHYMRIIFLHDNIL